MRRWNMSLTYVKVHSKSHVYAFLQLLPKVLKTHSVRASQPAEDTKTLSVQAKT